MNSWSDPLELSLYRNSCRSPGVYMIGSAIDLDVPVVGSNEEDAYLLHNWPDNFKPHYIGISESRSIGVRGRLSVHKRCKGNKGIAQRVRRGDVLYFVALYGTDIASYEALFLLYKSQGLFEDNVRSELERDLNRRYRRVRAEMTPFERDFYDNLDYDGRGL